MTLSPEERAARKRLGIAVVALVGHAEVAPRYLGDNMGGRAVCATASDDPRFVYRDAPRFDLARTADLEQPWAAHRMVTLDWVYVPSAEHATRLKAALDVQLTSEAHGTRHRWRELAVDFDMAMLGLLFDAAARVSHCKPFDGIERDRRWADERRRLARKRGGILRVSR